MIVKLMHYIEPSASNISETTNNHSVDMADLVSNAFDRVPDTPAGTDIPSPLNDPLSPRRPHPKRSWMNFLRWRGRKSEKKGNDETTPPLVYASLLEYAYDT